MQNYCKVFMLSLVFCFSTVFASPGVTIGDYENDSFSPAKGELFSIPLEVSAPQKIKDISVIIKTQDEDVITELPIPLTGASSYIITWDGKDISGELVPDEAYFPYIKIRTQDGEIHELNPGDNTGGEQVYDFEKSIEPKSIEYNLPVTSRVLIRSGIKNGPMLRTIIDWEPRTEGFHAERWSGRDNEDLISLDQNPEVGYLIVGYKLPDFAIITYGNTKRSYRDYREAKNWPLPLAKPNSDTLSRGDTLIRMEYFTPILQQKSPRVAVVFKDLESRKPVTSINGYDEWITEVTLKPEDEVYLDQERFEISFFVDNEFIAEEEQGFVPFTWKWSPGRLGIKPGEHILTVNVSGYNGQVAVKNIAFVLEETEAP